MDDIPFIKNVWTCGLAVEAWLLPLGERYVESVCSSEHTLKVNRISSHKLECLAGMHGISRALAVYGHAVGLSITPH